MTRGREVIVCDVGDLTEPDMVDVAALARLQLVARRVGCEVRLRAATPALAELLVLTGLDEALPSEALLVVQARRQVEEGEHPGGVQEERDPGDLSV